MRVIILAILLAAAAAFAAMGGLRHLPSMATHAGVTGSEADCAGRFLGGMQPSMPEKQKAKTTTLCSTRFAVLHSSISRTPLWSAEDLTAENVANAHKTQRVSEFEPDARLDASDRAELDDYRRSGWDRGHLAPSGDMPDLASQAQSFILSNIAPQAAKLNRGSWADLESAVRGMARRGSGTTYVVTGLLFQGARIKTVPDGRVLIPTSMWKAVAVPGSGAVVEIASNDNEPRWRRERVSDFTAETGIDPFPALAAADRKQILEIARR